MATDINGLELMITTVAAAATPVLAYKFRERRARRPKNANEKLYQYYENYIDRLEKQLIAKDALIDAIYQQMQDQRAAYEKIISELEHKLEYQRAELDFGQKQVEDLRKQLNNMQIKSEQAHEHIRKLKKDAPDVPNS